MVAASEERAKYIVYAQKKNELLIRMPKSEIVIKKAIQEYEIYLRQLQEKLYTAFMEPCGDRVTAENLTRQIFEELDLPYLIME